MSIKTPLIAIFLLLSAGPAFAADADTKWYPTADSLEASGINRSDSGDYLTIAVAGDEQRVYSACNFDVLLPVGVTFTDSDNAAAGGDLNSTHSIACAVKDFGSRAKIICFHPSNSSFSAAAGSIANLAVTVHPLAKAGSNRVEFKEIALNSNDLETGYPKQWLPGNTHQNSSTATISIYAERSVEVNISDSQQWASLVLPFSLGELPEGVVAYKAVSINTEYEVELEEVSTLEPYKPYIIYAPEGWAEILTGTASEADYPIDHIAANGMLQADVNQHELTGGYLLNPRPVNPAFDIVSTPTRLASGQVYIPALNKEFFDETPASMTLKVPGSVKILEVAARDATSAPVFNLQGKQILHPQPGQIYISHRRISRK